MELIKTIKEEETRYDVYRNGIWYKHTGNAGVFKCADGSTCIYGEFEDAYGNIEYFN